MHTSIESELLIEGRDERYPGSLARCMVRLSSIQGL